MQAESTGWCDDTSKGTQKAFYRSVKAGAALSSEDL